jgi:hypothetical protein
MPMPSRAGNRVVPGTHDGRTVILSIAIIDKSKRLSHIKSGKELLSGVKPYRALIDTGATTTMITTKVVKELNINPVTEMPIRGIHGVENRFFYLFHIGFYGNLITREVLEKKSIDTTKEVHSMYVYPKDILGAELSDQPNFDVLLGMDVLSTGTLHIDRDGSFSFSF